MLKLCINVLIVVFQLMVSYPDHLSWTAGIRQGWPLSALLFFIAAEFLSVNIKNNHTIQGFRFNDNSRFEIKMVQMADDTTVFTSNMLSVSNVLTEIDKLSFVSGILMNKHKTEGTWLGITTKQSHKIQA